MKVVLDTNVLVSGLLNPYGAPGLIVVQVAEGRIRLCYDARIISEYSEVLRRPRFGFAASNVESLLDQIQHEGYPTAAVPLPTPLPDRDDEPFLEVAVSGGAAYLVTGNTRHFPPNLRQGVKVVTPQEFNYVLRKS